LKILTLLILEGEITDPIPNLDSIHHEVNLPLKSQW
jgi:hypothetical protein